MDHDWAAVIFGILALVLNLSGYLVTVTVVVTKLGGRIDVVKSNQDNHARLSREEISDIKKEVHAIKSDIKQIDATEKLIAVLAERVGNLATLVAGIQQSMAVMQRDIQDNRTMRELKGEQQRD